MSYMHRYRTYALICRQRTRKSKTHREDRREKEKKSFKFHNMKTKLSFQCKLMHDLEMNYFKAVSERVFEFLYRSLCRIEAIHLSKKKKIVNGNWHCLHF